MSNNRLSKIETRVLVYLASEQGFMHTHLDLTTLDVLASKFNYSKSSIMDNVKHLLDLGYIEEKKRYDDDLTYYSITTKGKEHLEFEQEDADDRLKWSVYIPLAVTIGANVVVKLIEFLIE